MGVDTIEINLVIFFSCNIKVPIFSQQHCYASNKFPVKALDESPMIIIVVPKKIHC